MFVYVDACFAVHTQTHTHSHICTYELRRQNLAEADKYYYTLHSGGDGSGDSARLNGYVGQWHPVHLHTILLYKSERVALDWLLDWFGWFGWLMLFGWFGSFYGGVSSERMIA